MADTHLTLVSTPESTLRVYSFYRSVLAALLLGLYLSGVAKDVLGNQHPELFVIVVAIYLVVSACSHIYYFLHNYAVRHLSQLVMFAVDIIAITLLAHASGGLQSGLGYLLLVAVASASISLRNQLAYFLAALATISVLIETWLMALEQSQPARDSVSSGLLGILLFLTVFTFQLLAAKTRDAQQLAITREVEAADLQRLNEAIIQNMQTGIIVIDSADTIRLINGAAIQLLGGQQPDRPLGVNQSARTMTELYQQLNQWQTYPWVRTPSFTPQGGYTEIQANFTSLSTGSDDQNRQVLVFLEDTRTLAQYAQQLKLSSLGRLTGSIAHEVRNPLGAISHAAQLLSEHQVNQQQQKLLDIINRQTNRVNQIIENIMQLSRQRVPEFQRLSLTQWLKKFWQERQEEVQDGASIEVIEEQTEINVFFDPSHLLQILSNLLENAFRYSRETTGDAKATLKIGTDTISGLPYLDVINQGPKIKRQEQDKIFDPFFTTSNQGTGLGLYVSKQLCEVNYATLSYIDNDTSIGSGSIIDSNTSEGAQFRIGFSHPDRLMPGHKSE